ncbi:single-stranded DNA-binding protein [Neobacillus notoginsengisoli]|uniref:Single-stranded DNA-binding protein n=1 Tax=Neobacillus notoginsengisoli TaxID=1578198 RepID=A0A417YQ29_9BACI|nr:single-stranded DNA-binding protein [Neobacillus notoginsengisoli]RHW35942.1 single-stranded DNA-binding protein [Neobacillus notoginsengisoli]
MNSLNLVGRLTKQMGDLKGDENKVGLFTIAVQRKYLNQKREREADFIQVKVFNKLAENCKKYLGKGSLVSVTGFLRTSSFERDGKRNFTMEVIADEVRFLDNRNNPSNNEDNNSNNNNNYDPFSGGTPTDDWPF